MPLPTIVTSTQPTSVVNAGDICPICGHDRPVEFLRAPDRFHARTEPYTLMRCPHCSLVWLSDSPTPEQMHLHYTDDYNRLISAGGKDAPERWRARKETLTQYKQSGALLDLGCSSGSFLAYVRNDGWRLYGVEMSAAEAEAARAKTGAQVFVGTVAEATFEPESFDVITCFDVLEHLYDPRVVLDRVAQWLKPGGIFYVLVPNINSAEAKVFGSYWVGLELPRHLFHYTPKSLKFLAESAGLRTVSLETHRNSGVGDSMRYVLEAGVKPLGIHLTPASTRDRVGSLPWRAARKVARMTVLKALLASAPLFGGGESIHAVFQKSGAKG